MPRRKKARSRSRSKSFGVMNYALGGFGYGAARGYISNLLQPLTQKIPGGIYADNLVMGVVAWLAAKGKIPVLSKSVPMLRNIGKAGLAVEGALLSVDVMGNIKGTATATGGSFK